jgi:hypothetical protein
LLTLDCRCSEARPCRDATGNPVTDGLVPENIPFNQKVQVDGQEVFSGTLALKKKNRHSYMTQVDGQEVFSGTLALKKKIWYASSEKKNRHSYMTQVDEQEVFSSTL